MRRKILEALLLVLAIIMQQSAGFAQIIPAIERQEAVQSFEPNLRNNPLPRYPETLKVLGIGNSFTDDSMQYLPNLLSSAGIKNVTLGNHIMQVSTKLTNLTSTT